MRPIYGGFPVKFRTHLGPPIYYEEGVTPKELQEKTAAAIEKLIVENQRIPGKAELEHYVKVFRTPSLLSNFLYEVNFA